MTNCSIKAVYRHTVKSFVSFDMKMLDYRLIILTYLIIQKKKTLLLVFDQNVFMFSMHTTAAGPCHGFTMQATYMERSPNAANHTDMRRY